jgi:chemotaxis protein methyltransferase CheR
VAARDEWERFVNSLTTNLTSFFREPHHFPLLADHLNKLGSKRPIRIWCSAASTGEEPYSIAMTVLETCGANVSHVSIFASDLDTNVLATAQKGVYPIERVEKNIAGSPEALFSQRLGKSGRFCFGTARVESA